MEDENKALGIITSSDFIGYLKEKLNLDDVRPKCKNITIIKGRGQKVKGSTFFSHTDKLTFLI